MMKRRRVDRLAAEGQRASRFPVKREGPAAIEGKPARPIGLRQHPERPFGLEDRGIGELPGLLEHAPTLELPKTGVQHNAIDHTVAGAIVIMLDEQMKPILVPPTEGIRIEGEGSSYIEPGDRDIGRQPVTGERCHASVHNADTPQIATPRHRVRSGQPRPLRRHGNLPMAPASRSTNKVW